MLEICRSFIVSYTSSCIPLTYTQAVGHIAQRRRCFLEQQEWRTVPWANDVHRPLSSRLCDLLCEVPGLMEEMDVILESEAEGSDMSIERAILQHRIIDVLDRLADLRWLWEAMYPLACAQEPRSDEQVPPPPFETRLAFENTDRAADVVYFNAVRLLLYTLSDQAGLTEGMLLGKEHSQRDGPVSNPLLLLPGVRGGRIAHALEICRAAEFLMRGNRGSQGILVLLFPLRVAYTHVQHLPRVAGWIRRVLGESGTRGFKLGEHVLNIQSESARAITN